MNRHAYYYSAGQHKRELEELWALDRADVCRHSRGTGSAKILSYGPPSE